MPRILVVEDDPAIVAAVEKTLSMAGSFTMKAVLDPAQAVRAAIRHRPDLILLDIRMPGGDGRMILKTLKANAATQAIPVIFLTGLSSEGDKVLGLNLGADDYVVKPFGAMELLARLQAVLRRYRPAPSRGARRAKGLELDAENRAVLLDGRPVRLQAREFEILKLLAAHPGRAMTRAFLIENSSSYGLEVSTRSLDTHIKNIRKKLGRRAGLIETVPKLGYRLVLEAGR